MKDEKTAPPEHFGIVISEILTELAEDKSMSKWEVFKASGLPKSSVFDIFQGVALSPNFWNVYAIVQALGVRFDVFAKRLQKELDKIPD